MSRKLITRAEFAAMVGVTRPAITKAVNSGALKFAFADGKIDIEHPDAVEYIESHTRGKRPTNPTAPTPPVARAEPQKTSSTHQAAKTASAHLKLAEQTKLLVRRDFVDRLFNKISLTWESMLTTGASALALNICRELNNINQIDSVEKIIREHLEGAIAETCKEVNDEIENF